MGGLASLRIAVIRRLVFSSSFSSFSFFSHAGLITNAEGGRRGPAAVSSSFHCRPGCVILHRTSGAQALVGRTPTFSREGRQVCDGGGTPPAI